MQDMVAEEYHLDVLGINLQGGRKTSKNKFALVSPKQRGGEKMKILAEYQGSGTRGQGPARYHTDQVRPKLIQIRPLCGSNQTKVARNVPEPILAPEKRSRGIRWGDRHHFSRSIWPEPPGFQKSRKIIAFHPPVIP